MSNLQSLQASLKEISTAIAGVQNKIRKAREESQKHDIKVRKLKAEIEETEEGTEKEEKIKELEEYTAEYESLSQSVLHCTLLSPLPPSTTLSLECSQPIITLTFNSENEEKDIVGIKKDLATITVSMKVEGIDYESDVVDVDPLCKNGVIAVEELTLKGSNEDGGEEEREVKIKFGYKEGTDEEKAGIMKEYEGLSKERMRVISELRKVQMSEMQGGEGGGGEAVKRGFLNNGRGKNDDKSMYGKLFKFGMSMYTTGEKYWRYKNFLLFAGYIGLITWADDQLDFPEPL